MNECQTQRSSSPVRDILELLIATALMGATIQVCLGIHPEWMFLTVPVTILFVIVTQKPRWRGWEGEGLRPRNWRVPALWVGVPSFVLCLICLFIGLALDSIRTSDFLSGLLLIYPLWGYTQQYLLQRYLLPRLEWLGKERWVIVAAAVLFGAMHLPNGPLVLATALAGVLWIIAFRRWGNLHVNALSHAAVASALWLFLPLSWTRNFRIGGMLEWSEIFF